MNLSLIPDFNHVVDCFNKDVKWTSERLNLNSDYANNVETLVEFMKKQGLSYLDAINEISWK